MISIKVNVYLKKLEKRMHKEKVRKNNAWGKKSQNFNNCIPDPDQFYIYTKALFAKAEAWNWIIV